MWRVASLSPFRRIRLGAPSDTVARATTDTSRLRRTSDLTLTLLFLLFLLAPATDHLLRPNAAAADVQRELRTPSPLPGAAGLVGV